MTNDPPISKWDDIGWVQVKDGYTDSTGTIYSVHMNSQCAPKNCCIHNPSDHHMKNWPTIIRADKYFLMERVCSHGTGHPDPDSLVYLVALTGDSSYGVHGCDGCCQTPLDTRVTDWEYEGGWVDEKELAKRAHSVWSPTRKCFCPVCCDDTPDTWGYEGDY